MSFTKRKGPQKVKAPPLRCYRCTSTKNVHAYRRGDYCNACAFLLVLTLGAAK